MSFSPWILVSAYDLSEVWFLLGLSWFASGCGPSNSHARVACSEMYFWLHLSMVSLLMQTRSPKISDSPKLVEIISIKLLSLVCYLFWALFFARVDGQIWHLRTVNTDHPGRLTSPLHIRLTSFDMAAPQWLTMSVLRGLSAEGRHAARSSLLYIWEEGVRIKTSTKCELHTFSCI
jgi:hypothetical protein